jgi:hypothetical protein
MLQTIILGSCISVQGLLEKKFPDGRISVRVGQMVKTHLTRATEY